MSTLAELLSRMGPMTTSQASAYLQETGLSSDAARKAVSRRGNSVSTLFGLPFPKRARFIYLNDQFGTDRYWSNLIKAIEESNPAFAAALSAIKAQGGLILMKHFDTICGSPLKQKRQLASSVVFNALVAAKLISSVTIEGIGELVTLGQFPDPDYTKIKRLKARMLTERVLLDAIRSWSARMNLSSHNTLRIRDESPAPQVGTFKFDMSGPCYLQPLVSYKSGKLQPGFLAADVILGQDLDEQMVAPFLRKCIMLANLNGCKPVLSLLIADSFTPAALSACRTEGIIATRPETLFGRDVARALEDLLKTLTRLSATESQLEGLFKRLGTIEGAAGNLRGALFELVVAHCVRAIEGGTVDVGVVVTDPAYLRAEIDVRMVKEKDVRVYECKGYQPASGVRADEVEKWLTQKIPTIYCALRKQEQFLNAQMRFEFWTTGEFDDDAVDALQTAKETTKKYQIFWKNGEAIRRYASQLSAPGLRKMLDEHYFNHPINVFEMRTASLPGDPQGRHHERSSGPEQNAFIKPSASI